MRTSMTSHGGSFKAIAWPTGNKPLTDLTPLQDQLHEIQLSWSFLQKWEFSHYRQPGFLGWVARLILLMTPRSQASLDEAQALKLKIQATSLKKARLSSNAPAPTQEKSAAFNKLCGKKRCFFDPSHHAGPLSSNSHPDLWLKPARPLQISQPGELDSPPILQLPAWAEAQKKLTSYSLSHDLKLPHSLNQCSSPKLLSPALMTEDYQLPVPDPLPKQIPQDPDKLSWILSLLQIASHPKNFLDLPCSLQINYAFVSVALKLQSGILPYLTSRLRADKSLALLAIQDSIIALSFIDPILLKEEEILLAAIRKSPEAITFASQDLLDNLEFIKTAIAINASVLHYMPDEWEPSKEQLMIAIQQSGSYLSSASLKLREDKELVLAAVSY